MSFKDEFLKTPPGLTREELVYNAVIKQGPPKNLVPVTVPGPNGTKITYKVMADYVMIDGIRVTMTPATAQRVANYFHMSLPTAKMSTQIYDAAKTKVRAPPLSGTGYVSPLDGKRYSAKDVVKHRIGESDAAVYYSDLTNKELSKYNDPGLVSGHGKEITEPTSGSSNSDVSFGGWQGQSGDALQPYTYAHKGQAGFHTEYGLNTRLVSDDVVVTTSDGKVISTTMEKLRNSPNLAGAIANYTGIRQYDPKAKGQPSAKQTPTQLANIPTSTKRAPTKQQIPSNLNKSQPDRAALLQRIDSLLDQFSKDT